MTSDLTHAGGIVARLDGPRPRYLLVRARRNPDHLVFPKGHIEPGEAPEETALREVREEAGVEAEVLCDAGVLHISEPHEEARVRFYLMRHRRDVGSPEKRELRWCPYEEALTIITFENSRELLQDAHRKLQERLRGAAGGRGVQGSG